jgi:hypothetical protein
VIDTTVLSSDSTDSPTLTHPCSQELGLSPEQASFTAAPISSYAPPTPPDVVIALHTCDTATDDALALAYKQVSE